MSLADCRINPGFSITVPFDAYKHEFKARGTLQTMLLLTLALVGHPYGWSPRPIRNREYIPVVQRRPQERGIAPHTSSMIVAMVFEHEQCNYNSNGCRSSNAWHLTGRVRVAACNSSPPLVPPLHIIRLAFDFQHD